jgi:hypothetical protein
MRAQPRFAWEYYENQMGIKSVCRCFIQSAIIACFGILHMLNFSFSLSLCAIFMFGECKFISRSDVILLLRPVSHAACMHVSVCVQKHLSFNSARINWALDRRPQMINGRTGPALDADY